MLKPAMFVASLLLASAAGAAESLKATIDRNNAEFAAAFNKGDAQGVAQFYTEKATVLPPGAAMVRGREAIGKFWAGAIQSGLKNVTLQAVAVERYGKAAREIGRFTLDSPGGKIVGKYVVVWKQVGPDWKLDSDIWNSDK
jgi:ketosteroid isomerase-like protein